MNYERFVMKIINFRGALRPILCSLILFCATFLVTPQLASAVTIQWSPVGNPGNANDGTGFGSVPYVYNIGTKDVTVSQYVEFLNAKDANGANTLGLYNTFMSDANDGGINFNNGNLPGSKYGVIAGRGNHPANSTSWYDAIRFANWLNNGQGTTGSTETGAYTLGTLNPDGTPVTPPLTHNAGSQVWLPTENEWYKAAYYNPGGSSYNLYPTSSSLAPTASGPTALANQANFNNAVGNLTDVGAYTGTMSPYGAFDMGGNVFQWDEALISGSSRGVRGGSFGSGSFVLQSSTQFINNPSVVSNNVGFRVASTIPGLAGDYNHNNVVDPADYIIWRKGLGTTYSQNDYNVWRAHFGQTAGSGSGAGANASVPEPTTRVLLMFAAAGWCLRRGRGV
jgi:formylglycine-generating enzyme